jgi:hypothetical protein
MIDIRKTAFHQTSRMTKGPEIISFSSLLPTYWVSLGQSTVNFVSRPNFDHGRFTVTALYKGQYMVY